MARGERVEKLQMLTTAKQKSLIEHWKELASGQGFYVDKMDRDERYLLERLGLLEVATTVFAFCL